MKVVPFLNFNTGSFIATLSFKVFFAKGKNDFYFSWLSALAFSLGAVILLLLILLTLF